MTDIIKRDNLTVYQFLTFLKLQLDNGYTINEEFELLYKDYKEYCERNSLISLSNREFSYELNKIGIDSKRVWDNFSRKVTVAKDLSKSIIEKALTKLGGDMVVENIYAILDGKRYQFSIKIIPLDTPTIKELEAESKEASFFMDNTPEPDPTGEGEDNKI